MAWASFELVSCLALSSAGLTYRRESTNPVLKPCPPPFFSESSICVDLIVVECKLLVT